MKKAIILLTLILSLGTCNVLLAAENLSAEKCSTTPLMMLPRNIHEESKQESEDTTRQTTEVNRLLSREADDLYIADSSEPQVVEENSHALSLPNQNQLTLDNFLEALERHPYAEQLIIHHENGRLLIRPPELSSSSASASATEYHNNNDIIQALRNFAPPEMQEQIFFEFYLPGSVDASPLSAEKLRKILKKIPVIELEGEEIPLPMPVLRDNPALILESLLLPQAEIDGRTPLAPHDVNQIPNPITLETLMQLNLASEATLEAWLMDLGITPTQLSTHLTEAPVQDVLRGIYLSLLDAQQRNNEVMAEGERVRAYRVTTGKDFEDREAEEWREVWEVVRRARAEENPDLDKSTEALKRILNENTMSPAISAKSLIDYFFTGKDQTTTDPTFKTRSNEAATRWARAVKNKIKGYKDIASSLDELSENETFLRADALPLWKAAIEAAQSTSERNWQRCTHNMITTKEYAQRTHLSATVKQATVKQKYLTASKFFATAISEFFAGYNNIATVWQQAGKELSSPWYLQFQSESEQDQIVNLLRYEAESRDRARQASQNSELADAWLAAATQTRIAINLAYELGKLKKRDKDRQSSDDYSRPDFR